MGVVSWGKGARYKFVSAGELRLLNAPPTPAVFAITYRQDPWSKPKSHTVLYFGHADNLSAEMPNVQNDLENVWLQSGGKMEELFVFMHPMPGTTRNERLNLQQQLVRDYGPKGNY